MKTVKVKVSNIDWDITAQDFDRKVSAKEIKQAKSMIPTEYETEVEIDEELGKLTKKELDDYVSEVLIDKISDDFGYCHNGFNYEIIGESK